MKLGMGNTLKGKVVEIERGTITTKVTVDIGGGDTIIAIVTDAALKALGTRVGDEWEVLKVSEVMEPDRVLH
jgi:molybdopterin-binding protein